MCASYAIVIGLSSNQILKREAKTATLHNTNHVQNKNMSASDIHWKSEISAKVPAKPFGLWTVAYEYVRGPALIRFSSSSTNEWRYAPDRAATADGDLGSMIAPQGCVLAGAPVGA